MIKKKPDKIADGNAPEDRGEGIGLMEPMRLSEGARDRQALIDLAVDLAARSAAFKASLPEGVAVPLASLVRAMNCYYSNLIEGHNTHPVDIERALAEDFSADVTKRNLQLEAKAHISVQSWIDGGGLTGTPTSRAALLEIHRRFCEALPDELLWAQDQDGGNRTKIIPGALRDRDVRVGRHLAISPGAVPRFLTRFEEAYANLGRVEAILATAAAHHRLLWIHPFLDGNGRVARLLSHAMFLRTVDSGALWSVARGLARSESTYKQHLASCDLPRRNDLDGRGTLSEEALSAFTRFMLETAIDQVEFMRALVAPDALRARILAWADEEIKADRLAPRSGQVLEAILYRGELPRADIPNLLGVSERQARRVTTGLQKAGVVTAASTRAPLRLTFLARLAARWMPGLFPEQRG